MKDSQYRSLARYIHGIAKEFGLNDWSLQLHSNPPDDEGALAAVETVYGRRIAHIHVCEDFDEYPPEQQRIAILHELTHIHEAQIMDLVANTLPGALGSGAFSMFNAGWRQAMEHSTDAIATAIADKYPLWMP